SLSIERPTIFDHGTSFDLRNGRQVTPSRSTRAPAPQPIRWCPSTTIHASPSRRQLNPPLSCHLQIFGLAHTFRRSIYAWLCRSHRSSSPSALAVPVAVGP